MRTRTKVAMSIIALMLSCVLLITGIIVGNSTNKTEVVASSRTIELSQSALDAQSVLNEFEDAALTRVGATTYFEGIKSLDSSAFSELDYISDIDFEELTDCTVKYNFSYNSETNVITLTATANLSDGTIDVDEITGVGFLNEDNEIDAVMNIDGEGILLSEMRDAGLIQNCSWLSKIIKKVAKKVAVAATVLAVGALVVATVGFAAPAVVAASIGATTTFVLGTAATAATIGTYAALTAALAAHVYISADTWEKFYPGINVTTSNNNGIKIYLAKWSKESTKSAIRDIIKTEKHKDNPSVYFHVTKYNQANGPIQVELKGYTQNEMASKMSYLSWSSLTYTESLAKTVLLKAFPTFVLSDLHTQGMTHYHMLYRGTKKEARGKNGSYVVHSYYTDIIAV